MKFKWVTSIVIPLSLNVLLNVFLNVFQYVRDPITCWAPVHFTGAHVKFMTSYCWVKNTYYLPWTKPIPRYDHEPRQMVPYYQWIPFILLAQVCTLQCWIVTLLHLSWCFFFLCTFVRLLVRLGNGSPTATKILLFLLLWDFLFPKALSFLNQS